MKRINGSIRTFAQYRKEKIQEMLEAVKEMREIGYTAEEIAEFEANYELPSTRTAMGY